MQIALPNTQTFEKKEPLYTNEELHLLHQLENGLVKSTSHERCDEKPETGTKTR